MGDLDLDFDESLYTDLGVVGVVGLWTREQDET